MGHPRAVGERGQWLVGIRQEGRWRSRCQVNHLGCQRAEFRTKRNVKTGPEEPRLAGTRQQVHVAGHGSPSFLGHMPGLGKYGYLVRHLREEKGQTLLASHHLGKLLRGGQTWL